MMTFDGTLVAPRGTNAPSLEAIALGLARRPRFAGQTSRPFNVLAHSFLVADLIEDEAVKVHGLLHDAAESIVGDIPTPWKTDADRRRENDIMARIYRSLVMEPYGETEIMIVDAADGHALMAETMLLMPASCPIPRLAIDDSALKLASDWIGLCNADDWGIDDHWQKLWCRLVRAAIQKL